MARVIDFIVRGTVGNTVTGIRNGKPWSRSKRGRIKQTAPTKVRGINFGIAARAGKALRPGLHEVIPFPADRSMQSRFSGAIAKWMSLFTLDTLAPCNVVPYLGTLSFTKGYSFKERFKVPFVISQVQNNVITVSIDAFVPTLNVSAPVGTVSINCTIAVAGCVLKNGTVTGNETHSFLFPYNNVEIPSQVLSFHLPVVEGSLIVTGAYLEYNMVKYNMLTKIANPAFIPAGVIDAQYI